MTKPCILSFALACGAALTLVGCASANSVATPTPSSAGVDTVTPEATATSLPAPRARQWLIVDASFVSPTDGWLVRRDVNSSTAEVLATRDGGVSWVTQYVSDDFIPFAMQFTDASNGWIVGRSSGTACAVTLKAECHGVLVETHDGGAHWAESARGGNEATRVLFANPEDGWLLTRSICDGCDDVSLSLLRTVDGGRSWQQTLQASEPSNVSFPPGTYDERLARADAESGWIVELRTLLVTTDGGTTWTSRSNPCSALDPPGTRPSWFASAAFQLSPSIGWIGCITHFGAGGMGPALLFRTDDGALTWQLIADNGLSSVPTTPVIRSVAPIGVVADLYFFDGSNGWLVQSGPDTRQSKTSDGGRTWVGIRTGAAGGISRIAFVDRQHAWLWAPSPQLLRSEDGGATWTILPALPSD